MPPSGFGNKSIEGLLVFLEGCYEDLLREMDEGVDPKETIRKELQTIRRYLREFSISERIERLEELPTY